MATQELEMLFEIHDEHGHYKFQIGPDLDGELETIEIRYYDTDDGKSKCTNSVMFSRVEAALIVKALTKLLQDKP